MALYDRENAEQKTGSRAKSELDDGRNLNLALVQFAQFIEHDLSKTVSQSMSKAPQISLDTALPITIISYVRQWIPDRMLQPQSKQSAAPFPSSVVCTNSPQ